MLHSSCRFRQGQLVEVNAHSLFSKWFSESGKLVSRLFSKIMELVSQPAAQLYFCSKLQQLRTCAQAMLTRHTDCSMCRWRRRTAWCACCSTRSSL